MKILGVRIDLWKFQTLNVEFNEKLNKEIIKIIIQKIDCIYTHWHGDIHMIINQYQK